MDVRPGGNVDLQRRGVAQRECARTQVRVIEREVVRKNVLLAIVKTTSVLAGIVTASLLDETS